MPNWLDARAAELDAQDELKEFRHEFALPAGKTYLCGNSLGPMPRELASKMQQELQKWAEQGVEGHFTEPNPWVSVDSTCVASMARLVGAEKDEIAVMNSLTVNLHLLLTSFYQPDIVSGRCKILMERNAFPSDLYCVHSHVRARGLDPSTAVVLCDNVLTELSSSSKGDDVALCFVGGVNYQTGELFELEAIARACQQRGIVLGMDLAHAAGNVELRLHAWGVDFAAWCTYKYLNSGPGGIACAFVHQRHHHATSNLNRLEGWWGNQPSNRFEMKPLFEPAHGASAWQLSNPPVFQMTALRASLDVFDRIPDLGKLHAKSNRMTEFLLQAMHRELPKGSWSSLTPTQPARRGCQQSLVFPSSGPSAARALFDALARADVVCDFREPNIIRVAPNPLYNSFGDVARFVSGLRAALMALKAKI